MPILTWAIYWSIPNDTICNSKDSGFHKCRRVFSFPLFLSPGCCQGGRQGAFGRGPTEESDISGETASGEPESG